MLRPMVIYKAPSAHQHAHTKFSVVALAKSCTLTPPPRGDLGTIMLTTAGLTSCSRTPFQGSFAYTADRIRELNMRPARGPPCERSRANVRGCPSIYPASYCDAWLLAFLVTPRSPPSLDHLTKRLNSMDVHAMAE